MSGSTHLPLDFQLSGIVRWLSGSPFTVQAGVDLDGDGQTQSDSPVGLPISVGMGDVASQLAIDRFRASRNLAPIADGMLGETTTGRVGNWRGNSNRSQLRSR